MLVSMCATCWRDSQANHSQPQMNLFRGRTPSPVHTQAQFSEGRSPFGGSRGSAIRHLQINHMHAASCNKHGSLRPHQRCDFDAIDYDSLCPCLHVHI